MSLQAVAEPSPDASRIEISINRLPQLFNSLDPSPFHERDLDDDAEAYIVASAEELPRQRPFTLVIHLPADQVSGDGMPDLSDAIHNYFAYRAVQARRRLRLLFRDGRLSLLIGLGFLVSCVLVREVALSFPTRAFSEIVAEGMLIIGWVAMWRPLDTFLYEWWPIRRRCRVYEKLSIVPVVVRAR